MLTYEQATGILSDGKEKIAKGYSGFHEGKNNPAMQNVKNIGPIPKGVWNIGQAHDSSTTGPVTMDLFPEKGTQTFGRDLFRIHGDSRVNPGSASHGCLIFPRPIREFISQKGYKKITVI